MSTKVVFCDANLLPRIIVIRLSYPMSFWKWGEGGLWVFGQGRG